MVSNSKDVSIKVQNNKNIKSIIFVMMIPLVVGSLLFLGLYFSFPNFYLLELYIGLWIFCICLILPYVFYEKLDKIIGSNSSIRLNATYQWSSVMSSMFYLVLMVWMLIISNIMSWKFGFFVSLGCVIPFIFAFFGVKIFNDSSCYLNGEIVFGYHYIYSWISLFIGLIGFYIGAKLINVNLDCAIMVFIVSMFFQLVFVMPNVVNNYIPFELKTKKGFYYFSIVVIILYFIIIFILSPKWLFIIPNIVLSTEQLIKNVLVYGVGIILALLFYRKAKKMNDKKK